MKTYIDAWKEQTAQQKRIIQQRKQQALEIVTKAVEILKKEGATRVILFGSLVNDSFQLKSDIDIAVEMPFDSYWKWYLDIEDDLNFPIDLVNLKMINPSFKKFIFEHGKILYEK